MSSQEPPIRNRRAQFKGDPVSRSQLTETNRLRASLLCLGARSLTSFSLEAYATCRLKMTTYYSLVLPESAAESVNSSADSRPPPAGIPRAMRVSVIGLPFNRSTM